MIKGSVEFFVSSYKGSILLDCWLSKPKNTGRSGNMSDSMVSPANRLPEMELDNSTNPESKRDAPFGDVLFSLNIF